MRSILVPIEESPSLEAQLESAVLLAEIFNAHIDGTAPSWVMGLAPFDGALDTIPSIGETGAFSTLFGARHRFYGRADYFLNIPEDTGGLGLRDAALKFAYSPTSHLSLNLDLHGFTTARRGALSSRRLGEEVDLWIRYLFREALNVEAGYSLIRGGPAMEELDRLDGSGNTVYLMTSLRF